MGTLGPSYAQVCSDEGSSVSSRFSLSSGSLPSPAPTSSFTGVSSSTSYVQSASDQPGKLQITTVGDLTDALEVSLVAAGLFQPSPAMAKGLQLAHYAMANGRLTCTSLADVVLTNTSEGGPTGQVNRGLTACETQLLVNHLYNMGT